MSGRSRVGFDDREGYYREDRRDNVEIRVLDRDRERGQDRLPNFLREDRRPEPGPLVLRQREVETSERIRRRSPSPVRHVRARSVSPFPARRAQEDLRFRTVRAPSRPPSEVDRVRIVERDRSSSPSPSRSRPRFVERRRSPSPEFHERIRIVEKEREREKPRSPSPPPQPQVIKGPIIEREVITHYRDIDHGVMVVRDPSPAPPPRRREANTDIDIYTSRKETDIEIKRSTSRAPSRHRGRSRSRSRSRERVSQPHRHQGELFVHADTGRLHVDVEARGSHTHGRRAHSEAPPRHNHDYEIDEAREITSRIDAGGRMGEARHGITKDWTIIDVPPGTERVRLDGAGGAAAEVTWSKYSGVRRSKFIPDRDDKSTVTSSSVTDFSDRTSTRDDPRRSSRLSVQIYDKDKDREIDVIADRHGGRHHHHSPGRRNSDMWTEITKDLVIREAIEEMGYEYEETEYFFYIMTYLRYEDVLQLVQLSDAVRRARKERLHEIQWQSGYPEEYEREYRIHAHSHRHGDDSRHRSRHHRHGSSDERIVEREISYEHRGSSRYR